MLPIMTQTAVKKAPSKKPSSSIEDQFAYWLKRQERYPEIVAELLKRDPDLSITAYIIAGDLLSAEAVSEAVTRGDVNPDEAVWLVGSYARLDWAIANCTDDFLLANLPALWSGSDPDDTKPEYLDLWRRAFERNGGAIICDERTLPIQDEYQCYRGQREKDPIGISWSLDFEVAESFARGAGVRRPLSDGVIIEAIVPRPRILAYLTGRNESELIIILE